MQRSLYLNEDLQGSLVNAGYGFDFGDWSSYTTNEVLSTTGYTEFSDIFNNGKIQLVISRICADLGVMPAISPNIKLLISQSNCAPNLYFWKDKIQTLICCFSDAIYGMNIIQNGNIINIPSIDTGIFMKDEIHCDVGVYIGEGR
jgi:hypothetical protein